MTRNFSLEKFFVGENMAKGCEWNNPLAKENFNTNVKERGLEYAKQVLRTDIQHWMAKREGRPIPKWKASVDQEGYLVVADQRLIDLTRAPLTKEVNSPISEEVRALVPIELETVRQADKLAKEGAKKIYIPEHAPGGIHFITVYTQSPDNPREYIGSQIDLGENVTCEQAKQRIQTLIGRETSEIHQSTAYKEAFVFVADNNNKSYQKPPVDIVVHEVITTSQRVLRDVATTTISAGVFALETLRRRRAQKQLQTTELHNKEILVRNNRKEKNIFIFREQRNQAKRMLRFAAISQFVAETGVGVGAALFGLRQLAELTKNEKRRVRKHIERRYQKMKSKEQNRKKAEALQKKSKEAVNKEKKPFKKEAWIRTRKNKEMRRHRRREKKQSPVREFAISRKELTVWKTLLVLARRLQERKPRMEKKFKQNEGRQIRIQERKRVAVKFIFALLLWVFLKNESKHVRFPQSFKREKKIEAPAVKEPTQWVLLAIIWYLVMIREQRMPMRHKKQKKTKQKSLYSSQALPPSGVIFALAS